MKNIRIKKITFFMIFVSACALSEPIKAMDVISEEGISQYSPRLMCENLTSDSSERIEQKTFQSSDEWGKLYNAIISSQRFESGDSVVKRSHPKYFDSTIEVTKAPLSLEGGNATFKRGEIAQGFVHVLSSIPGSQVDSKQAFLKESTEVMAPPTQKEVKSFVRTFPRDFNPETADLQKVMGNKTMNTSSGVWKLSTFLFGHHATRRLEGQCQLFLPDDSRESYCYEVVYELPDVEESWTLLLTFAR